MKADKLKRTLAIVVAGLVVASCAERYVVAANTEVLVVVDEVKEGPEQSSATVHYILAEPQPLGEADGAKVTTMTYEALFRCADGSWGHSVQELTTESGETISTRQPRPVMNKPTPGSLADDVVRVVCDPSAKSKAATRRLLPSIRRDYLERMGQDAS